MPTNRTPLHRNRHGLSFEEKMSLEFGDHPCRPPAFRSNDERREAWLRHRERLLASCLYGRRPAGWWDYEAPIPRPRDQDYEQAALYEAGLLTEIERADLLARWREEFERAQEAGFVHCIGHADPGDTFASWLQGNAAKRAHYRWAGIPRELIRAWTLERRRRGRAVRKLKAEKTTPPAPARASSAR